MRRPLCVTAALLMGAPLGSILVVRALTALIVAIDGSDQAFARQARAARATRY